jgi:hypothetical protein
MIIQFSVFQIFYKLIFMNFNFDECSFVLFIVYVKLYCFYDAKLWHYIMSKIKMGLTFN